MSSKKNTEPTYPSIISKIVGSYDIRPISYDPTILEIIYGREGITGRLVTHLCDNPLCVRAEPGTTGHLFIGTHAENMAEREYRGRGNLHNPLWRHQGRAARAAAARLLRAHTIQNGYEQRQVDELVRGIVMPGQTPLF